MNKISNVYVYEPHGPVLDCDRNEPPAHLPY